MTYQVSVRCSTGGWVFHFQTREEAISYALGIRAGGNTAKIFKMERNEGKEA
jgi:hypothetical protein